MEYSAEMKIFFDQRTLEHIAWVKHYYSALCELDSVKPSPEINNHDSSKFENPEMRFYVLLTWKKHCKKDSGLYRYPKGVKSKIKSACTYHETTNRHHPEYWDESFKKHFTKTGQAPNDKIEATLMPEDSMREMVADWLAMSKEFGGSALRHAQERLRSKMIFTKEQKNRILTWLKQVENPMVALLKKPD